MLGLSALLGCMQAGNTSCLETSDKLSAVLTHDSCVLQVEWRGEILQLSWSPRAYHLKGFLSDEECEHIKKIVSNSSNSSQHHILLAMFLLHVPAVGSSCWLVLLSCMHPHKPILQLPNRSWDQLHAANSSWSKPFTQWYGCFLFSACSPGTS